jgi:hypothetical protein
MSSAQARLLFTKNSVMARYKKKKNGKERAEVPLA